MAKKKKFQKKQLISLFENENYQKVISKIKQFHIDGLTQDELQNILITSYSKLAQNNFEKGNIVRAIRDIDSLLQIDNGARFRLIKLKYLCYIENFEDAIKLGEELITLKEDKKLQKEAIFLYIMANLYSENYKLDKKLLQVIPISRQRYILGFAKFLQGERDLALSYFEKCNPRSRDEKNNLKAIKAIINKEKIDCGEEIKPIYRFLITGEARNIANTKNFRYIKKEIQEQFSKNRDNLAMKDLLSLKAPIDTNIISKNSENKEQETTLIYNNIILLVEQKRYNEALKIFLRYQTHLVNLIESVMLFIHLKKYVEDSGINNPISFFIKYLRLHHQKMAPFQLDNILLFLIQNYDIKRGIELAKEYGRDDFVFLLKELPSMMEFKPYYQTSLNRVVKRYSFVNDSLLKFIIEYIESTDKEIYNFTYKEEKIFLNYIFILMTLLQNLERPHSRYKDTIFKLLKVLALVIQSFSYSRYKSIYLKLSDVIEQYIEYFKINRVDLAIDIKALFVSISKKKSVKKDNIYDDEDDYFYIARKILFEDSYEENKYNFKKEEYDLSIIKQNCIDDLNSGKDKPFKTLKVLKGRYNYYRLITTLILDLLAKVIELEKDIDNNIDEMLNSLGISFSEYPFRDNVVSNLNSYATKDLNTVIILFEYLLESVPVEKREFVWYLKWILGYVNMVEDYNLNKNQIFRNSINYFLKTQKKKKFKSLSTKYQNIVNIYGKEGVKLD